MRSALPEAGYFHTGLTLSRRSVHIVGASLAGVRAAEALRRCGFEGPVALIGDEPHAPYDRPPLSKQFLAGDWESDRLSLIKSEKLTDLDLDIRYNTRAVAFSMQDRSLVTIGPNGERRETIDGLLIATGTRCRVLPGTKQQAGVFVLRDLDDAVALRKAFDAGPRRVVVVGAGFIGAEVAATARGRNLDVTMIEELPTPLKGVLGEPLGQIVAALHRDNGVDLRTGVGVVSVNGTDRVESVTLTDGSVVEADAVVVGIGVVPNTEWLQGSGLVINDGVVCDATCLAGPGVTAAGDVARWPNTRFNKVMRVEHWDNAIEQAMFAARRLLDDNADAKPFTPVGWFWSDQYKLKIQLAGNVGSHDTVRVVTGSVEDRRFAALYGRNDRLVGVVGFNRPRHVMKYKMLIEQGVSFSDALQAQI